MGRANCGGKQTTSLSSRGTGLINAPFFEWLQNTAVGPHMSGDFRLFPFIECFHIFGIVELLDATGIRDLRLPPLTLLPAQHVSGVS